MSKLRLWGYPFATIDFNKESRAMILAQVPLGSYGYLTNGDYFKLPDSSLNERKQFMEGLLTVILWPGTVMARLVEFPPSLPIRNIEKN